MLIGLSCMVMLGIVLSAMAADGSKDVTFSIAITEGVSDGANICCCVGSNIIVDISACLTNNPEIYSEATNNLLRYEWKLENIAPDGSDECFKLPNVNSTENTLELKKEANSGAYSVDVVFNAIYRSDNKVVATGTLPLSFHVVEVKNVTFDPEPIPYNADGEDEITTTASATIIPECRTITWSIEGDDDLGCTIDAEGVITSGDKGGVLTVRASDSVLAECYAEGTLDIIKIEFSVDEQTISWAKNGTYDVKELLTEDSHKTDNIEWSIECIEGEEATIDSSGVVSFGEGPGEYTISAVSGDLYDQRDIVKLIIAPELKLDAIDIWDSDKRHAKDGKLEIANQLFESVTGEALFESEDIILPSDFPVWTLNGSDEKIGQIVTYNIFNNPLDAALLFLPSVKPKRSTIMCEDLKVVVAAYPSDKRTITVKGNKLDPFKYRLEQILSLVLSDIDIDTPKGVISFANQWEECPSSNLAYWTYDLAAGFDPVVGIHGRFPFGPLASIPGWIKKYVEIGFFLEFNGKLTAKGQISRDNYGNTSGSAPLAGKIGGDLGFKVLLADKDFVSMEATGGTSITGSGNIAVESGIILKDARVDWDGITANVTIEMLWGLVSSDKEWTIVGAKKIWGPKDLILWTP